MKKILLALTLMASFNAQADEFITYTDGSTAFRNPSGYTYGHTGGVPTGDTGFNDTKTGERYESIGNGQHINTRTGQPLYTPQGYDSNSGQAPADGQQQ
ncbi:MAG: hypothetical protein RIQ94_3148 [Pseudomonadota bacterium]|jgi:hypothetical protein